MHPTRDFMTGDDASLDDEDVVRLYGEVVHWYCRRRLRDANDADDAAQNTFMRFIQRSERTITNPFAWLVRAASFACADLHRRQRRDTVLHMLAPATAESEEPEDAVITGMVTRQVLQKLDAEDGELLTMLYLEDRPIEEVAKQLGLSNGNVRIRAFRARGRARRVLDLLESA